MFQSIDTRRQAALHRLLCLEENFVEMMHSGIQQFSRPLRHCLLSSAQHEQLFQNVEKVHYLWSIAIVYTGTVERIENFHTNTLSLGQLQKRST